LHPRFQKEIVQIADLECRKKHIQKYFRASGRGRRKERKERKGRKKCIIRGEKKRGGGRERTGGEGAGGERRGGEGGERGEGGRGREERERTGLCEGMRGGEPPILGNLKRRGAEAARAGRR